MSGKVVERSIKPPLTPGEAEAYRRGRRVNLPDVPNHLSGEFEWCVAVIPGRLFFGRNPRHAVVNQQLPGFEKTFCFSTDSTMVYDPYCDDFGPLDLGQTHRYLQKVADTMRDAQNQDLLFVHYTSKERGRAENAAYLMAAFCVLKLGQTPAEAITPFLHVGYLQPFRDASFGASTYDLRLYACLEALHHAAKLGWYNPETFDLQEYEEYEQVSNGDLNWIIPRKFIAFSGPSADLGGGVLCLNRPEKYVSIFKKLNVGLVIRLNKKQYSKRVFTRAGIDHKDFFFVDGSCPSIEITRRFIAACEKEKRAIAVHCKAGLGRTGTLIGCYAIKHYGFHPAEWIGWNRICRPGSVLGPQQHFLHCVLQEGWLTTEHMPPRLPLINTRAILQWNSSFDDHKIAQIGDRGQGERLMSAKHRGESTKASSVTDSLTAAKRLAAKLKHLETPKKVSVRVTDLSERAPSMPKTSSRVAVDISPRARTRGKFTFLRIDREEARQQSASLCSLSSSSGSASTPPQRFPSSLCFLNPTHTSNTLPSASLSPRRGEQRK